MSSDEIRLDLLHRVESLVTAATFLWECLCLCSDVIRLLSHFEALAWEIGDSAYSPDSLCWEQSEPVREAREGGRSRWKSSFDLNAGIYLEGCGRVGEELGCPVSVIELSSIAISCMRWQILCVEVHQAIDQLNKIFRNPSGKFKKMGGKDGTPFTFRDATVCPVFVGIIGEKL